MSRTGTAFFSNGKSYVNVYFLKIDASGHSDVVQNNPQDFTDKFFDLFESTVYSLVTEKKRFFNCEYAEFWGWQGDGGLCVIHDDNESVASNTALNIAVDFLDSRLDSLKNTFEGLSMKGKFHVRLAIHKGSFKYTSSGGYGSIHSRDLNFVAHLEKVTPKDSLAISEEAYKTSSGRMGAKFEPLDFSYEGKNVYIYSKKSKQDRVFEWISNIKISNSFRASICPQRLSELDKSVIVKNACEEVIDLGTALNTCSYYLVSTQRPTYYRNEVIKLLDSGVNYTCLVLNPEADITDIYSAQRNERLKERINDSLTRLSEFGKEVKHKKGKFTILLYSQLPYFASIAIDRKKSGIVIFSPYMPCNEALTIRRADSPHLIVAKEQNNAFFDQVNEYIDSLLRDTNTKEF